jgi:hypothetical protein
MCDDLDANRAGEGPTSALSGSVSVQANRNWLAVRPHVADKHLFLNCYGEPIGERGVRKLVTRYRLMKRPRPITGRSRRRPRRRSSTEFTPGITEPLAAERGERPGLTAIREWAEWQEHQFVPSYWVDGRIPPYMKSRRLNWIALLLMPDWVTLCIAALLLLLGGSQSLYRMLRRLWS